MVFKVVTNFSLQNSLFQPRTPLTNRLLLSGRDNGKITPVSIAVHSLSKLQTLLQGQELKFSKAFVANFMYVHTLAFMECVFSDRVIAFKYYTSRNDSTEILTEINSRLDILGEKFLSCYCSPYKDHPGGTRGTLLDSCDRQSSNTSILA